MIGAFSSHAVSASTAVRFVLAVLAVVLAKACALQPGAPIDRAARAANQAHGAPERPAVSSLAAPTPARVTATPLSAPAVSDVTGAGPVLVGVVNSHIFRMAEAPRRELRRAGAPARFRPLAIAAQDDAGFRAFHFPVLADPDRGRFARGRGGRVDEWRLAGLKVIDPNDRAPDAICFTMMRCLMEVDAASRARPGHAPWLVVLDLRALPAPRWYRWTPGVARFLLPDPGARDAPPLLADVAREMSAVLSPERVVTSVRDPRAAGRLMIMTVGGRGEPPADALFVQGVDVEGAGLDPVAPVVMAASALSDREAAPLLQAAVYSGVFAADWAGERDTRLSALEAARLGADVILLTPEAAR